MKSVTRTLKLYAIEHLSPKHIRIALVLLTLATLVISAGAPGGFGDGSGG